MLIAQKREYARDGNPHDLYDTYDDSSMRHKYFSIFLHREQAHGVAAHVSQKENTLFLEGQ